MEGVWSSQSEVLWGTLQSDIDVILGLSDF